MCAGMGGDPPGIGAELAGIELGDERLNRRSVQVLETLAAQPQASINAACGGWNETIASYRLFKHADVSPEKILAPHQDATRERMRRQPVVLIVQDTTELDFTAHPPRDARCLDNATRFGCYDHTSLAVTPERICLGVVGQELFDRSPESLGKQRERTSWPPPARLNDSGAEGEFPLADRLSSGLPTRTGLPDHAGGQRGRQRSGSLRHLRGRPRAGASRALPHPGQGRPGDPRTEPGSRTPGLPQGAG